MGIAVIAGQTVAPPPPPPPDPGGGTPPPPVGTVSLRLPYSWVVTLVSPWGVQTSNPAITWTINETARLSWAVL